MYDHHVNASVWNPDFEYENFGDTPMKFKTPGDLRRYCKENGLSSGALL